MGEDEEDVLEVPETKKSKKKRKDEAVCIHHFQNCHCLRCSVVLIILLERWR